MLQSECPAYHQLSLISCSDLNLYVMLQYGKLRLPSVQSHLTTTILSQQDTHHAQSGPCVSISVPRMKNMNLKTYRSHCKMLLITLEQKCSQNRIIQKLQDQPACQLPRAYQVFRGCVHINKLNAYRKAHTSPLSKSLSFTPSDIDSLRSRTQWYFWHNIVPAFTITCQGPAFQISNVNFLMNVNDIQLHSFLLTCPPPGSPSSQ